MPLPIEGAAKAIAIRSYRRPRILRSILTPFIPAIRIIQLNIIRQLHGLAGEVIAVIHQLSE